VIREVYERYGFEPLETPAFENLDTLVGKYGEEGNKLIFKILKRGEHEATGAADLALRYDLTVPLSRVVAQYQHELPKFFKRFQIQPVWRADRPAKGRFREFYQCDIDAIGSTSPVVEADILGSVSEVLSKLGFSDFVIRLNDRRALGALLECAGVPEPLHADALIALDKLDKVGVDGVHNELTTRGIDAAATRRSLDFFRGLAQEEPHGGGRLQRLREFVAGDQKGTDAVKSLDDIVQLADGTEAHGHIQIDPSLARGLSYYTGAIMEIAVPDLAGSLGGGGRYDNLIGMFLGREVPACGFSLGLERLIVVMTERKMFPDRVARNAVEVLVTIWNDDSRGDSLRLARELRAQGLRVDVYPEPDKLGKQLKYASACQVPVVAIVGDDERARADVSIKDMRSGDQRSVSRADAAAGILEWLKR